MSDYKIPSTRQTNSLNHLSLGTGTCKPWHHRTLWRNPLMILRSAIVWLRRSRDTVCIFPWTLKGCVLGSKFTLRPHFTCRSWDLIFAFRQIFLGSGGSLCCFLNSAPKLNCPFLGSSSFPSLRFSQRPLEETSCSFEHSV